MSVWVTVAVVAVANGYIIRQIKKAKTNISVARRQDVVGGGKTETLQNINLLA